MANLLAAAPPSSLLRSPSLNRSFSRPGNCRKSRSLVVRAAKLPTGVDAPRVEPKLTQAFWGFTTTAEVWNSRACMIGLFGTFFVELFLHRGILSLIGVDVGKGLDLPL